MRRRASSKNLDLQIEPVNRDIRVFCDQEQLRRILANLLVNAIKFSPFGGTVKVSVDTQDEHQLRLSVVDSGIGIAPQDIQRIFQRFEQSHSLGASCKGFGLGLSIVHELCELNLGSIEVEQMPEQGNRFTVKLPKPDARSVLSCFLNKALKWTKKRRGREPHDRRVYLIEVVPTQSGTEIDSIQSVAIDSFLRGFVAASEVVIQSGLGWKIYSADPEFCSQSFWTRCESAWREFKHNFFESHLPEFSIGKTNSFPFDSELDSILASVEDGAISPTP